MNPEEKKQTAGVIGMGRFGTFWAEFLSQDFTVAGFSSSGKKTGFPPLRTLEEVCAMQTVFLCVPIRAMPAMLARIAPLVGPETLVADTCSVKTLPVRWMREILRPETKILATHPMFGPESAKFGLQGLPVVLHGERLPDTELEFWKSYFRRRTLTVITLTPEEHDREAAKTQALTHMVGRTLSRMGVQDSPIGTLWYRKLVSICRQVDKDSPELFSDMQHLNPFAAAVRKQFADVWLATSAELERDIPPACLDPDGIHG